MSQYAYDYNPNKIQSVTSQSIDHSKFNQWDRNNLYRSSYASHWTDKPQEPKSHVPPGYAGYIPALKPTNEYGASFGEITKNCLSSAKMTANPFKLSCTGSNYRKHDFKDPSLKAYSHKYGCQTLLTNHPGVDQTSDKWRSQTQDTFRNPKSQVNPTYRDTDKTLQTQKYFTKTSGFQQNHTTFDLTGWVPDKILDANRTVTEYRIHYKTGVPFHRDTYISKERKLPPPQYNYKHMG